MRERIERLSPRAEFWLVLVLAFGYFIAASTRSVFVPRPHVLTDARSLGLVVFELAILTIILWIGRVRGWSLGTLGLTPSWMLTGFGLLLYIATTVLIGFGVHAFLATTHLHVQAAPMTARHLTLVGILAISTVNPLFEETLVTGYVMRALRPHGAAFAVGASALLRFLYHTYQGPIAALYILPIGIVFAVTYWRTGQLWPLVVAHAVQDFLALGRLVH